MMKGKQAVAFLKKSSAKNFCPGGMGVCTGHARKSWMPDQVRHDLQGPKASWSKSFLRSFFLKKRPLSFTKLVHA
jgi:hypothetical protein